MLGGTFQQHAAGPLTYGSRRAEFERPHVSAGLLRNAHKALLHFHRSPNRSFWACFRTWALTGGQRVFISQPSASAGVDVKTIHRLTPTGVQKCMFFSRKVRRKAKNAHILTFFENSPVDCLLLTRGSSQAEFETVAFESLSPNVRIPEPQQNCSRRMRGFYFFLWTLRSR